MAVATSPWHLVVGALGAALTIVAPLVVGICAMFATALVLTALTGRDAAADGVIPLVTAAFFAALTAWWGPGGASLRRGSRSIVRGVSPGGKAVPLVVAALLAAAAVLGAASVAAEGPTWWPRPNAPGWIDEVIPASDATEIGARYGTRSGRLPACRSPTRHSSCWWAPPARASRPGRRSATAPRRSSPPTPCVASSGSGPHDLDASADAFAVLEAVVTARLGRGLTTVVDTLGFDAGRRRGWLSRARGRRAAGGRSCCSRPPIEVCRRRNADARPADARARAGRAAAPAPEVAAELADEGWDLVVPGHRREPDPSPAPATARRRGTADGERTASTGVEVVLQVSRFPWGEDPMAWLRGMALAADEAGFAGLALMDHLIQIPQVGRAWDPIPEPWVALGAVAGLGTGLRLGTLCTPVTFREPGITAKAAATLSALNGGPGLRRHRRGVVGARARGLHPAVPARGRAAG